MRRGAGVAWQGSLRLPLPVVPALSLLQQCGYAVPVCGHTPAVCALPASRIPAPFAECESEQAFAVSP